MFDIFDLIDFFILGMLSVVVFTAKAALKKQKQLNEKLNSDIVNNIQELLSKLSKNIDEDIEFKKEIIDILNKKHPN